MRWFMHLHAYNLVYRTRRILCVVAGMCNVLNLGLCFGATTDSCTVLSPVSRPAHAAASRAANGGNLQPWKVNVLVGDALQDVVTRCTRTLFPP